MKKIFALMVAVAFGLGAMGCDDKKTEPTKKPADTKPETKKM
ncbi:hypothetical protein [Telmatocola sphagniphila]|nr:hypothetical protein [Telmatocola sphagniphila]